MITARWCSHRHTHAHARACFDTPTAVSIALDVFRIVNRFVSTLDGKAVVSTVEAVTCGRITHRQTIIEPALASLADHQVLRRTTVNQISHRNVYSLPADRSTFERVFTGVSVAEPHASNEIRRQLFISSEKTIERKQHKHILLCAGPPPLRAIRKQTAHDLRNEIVLRLIADQCFEHHRISTTI